ncbi:Serine/threonine-protein kinase AFC1 [Diplonema papillatum]|nr:Serine/threonine-protein kinase AFC1 [Diplonema papillatum]|eukprot:gene1387-2134_t
MRVVTCPSSLHLQLHPGDELPTPWGVFSVEARVGSGHSSQVWTGVQRAADGGGGSRPVALKVYAASARCCAAATRGEARVLQAIHASRERAPAIVSCHGYFLIPGEPVPHVALVFERMGPSLWVLVDRVCKKSVRRERVSLARTVLREMLSALASVHALGMVHGDVKPENILSKRTSQGTNLWSFKLVDFNHCTEAAHAALPEDGAWQVGTLWYRSPEVLVGDPHALHPAADIWSLGCVAGEIVCSGAPLYPVDPGLAPDACGREMLALIAAGEQHLAGGAAQTGGGSYPPSSSSEADEAGNAADEQAYQAARVSVSPTFSASAAPETPRTATPPEPAPSPAFAYLFQQYDDEADQQLQDLLRGMLCAEPARRVTARQALRHPFLAADGGAETPSKPAQSKPAAADGGPRPFAEQFAAENRGRHASFCAARAGSNTKLTEHAVRLLDPSAAR